MPLSLRTVCANRYVTPLREGGSLPAIIEADDLGTYVLKFRGAGQGPKALIAELIGGEIARALGLKVPELVFVKLDAKLGRNEPDYEIRELIKASEGLNLALDYLPGSITFDPVADARASILTPESIAHVVWLDMFLTNVDRTARNANMLVWHKKLWMIDNGAALYFHHNWGDHRAQAVKAFSMIKDHVLLPQVDMGMLRVADSRAKVILTNQFLYDILELIPHDWLLHKSPFTEAQDARTAYLEFLVTRLENSALFLREIEEAQHGKR
jgi:hypothetical protein